MARGTLDEIMAGSATYRGTEILANVDETILAVETRRSWGVAFDFAVYDDGSYAAEAMWAVRTADGQWRELSDGGSWGDGWETPWRVPHDRWPGEGRLLALGWTALDGEDDDGVLVPFAAVYGFATRSVSTIRVEHDESSRAIKPSPCGAFLALEECEGPITLFPLDEKRKAIGPSADFRSECITDAMKERGLRSS